MIEPMFKVAINLDGRKREVPVKRIDWFGEHYIVTIDYYGMDFVCRPDIRLLQYTPLKYVTGQRICEGDTIKGKIKVLKWSEVKHEPYEEWVDIEPTIVEKCDFGFQPFVSWASRYLDILEMCLVRCDYESE